MKTVAFKIRLLMLFSAVATVAQAQTFTEVSQFAGINHYTHSAVLLGGGAAFFDYDNDGWLDIYITGGFRRDMLYHNNRDGTFTEKGVAAGLYAAGEYYTMGVVTGDIDNDGDRDILVTTWGGGVVWSTALRNILYRNNGDGTFTDIAPSAGITDTAWSVSASMGDYNLDGYLDIYVGNYVKQNVFIRDSITNEIIGFAHVGYPNYLYRNNGNNTFTQVAPQLSVNDSGVTLGVAFTDYDNDHDMDIYVANDFGAWTLPNALYRNEYPLNSFTDVSVASGTNAAIYGMGIAPGDYDEDGDLDYYVTNLGDNLLYRNNGNGTFTDVAAAAGVLNGHTPDSLLATGWGTAFFDYDNDTWLDLFVANGKIPSANIIATGEKDPNKLYKNNRNGTFTDVSWLEGIRDTTKGRGFITGDYDNDGDLDMLVVCTRQATTEPEKVLLYRNDQANGNHWVKVQVQGTANNRDGFGARVEVYANSRKWIREIDGGSSHASQQSSITHFGLESYTHIDSLAVIWPGGSRAVFLNVPVDEVIEVVEGAGASVQHDVYTQLCDGDSMRVGGAWQTTPGIYYDTLVATSGIDSIVLTHLSFLPNKATTIDYVVCEDDSVLVNGVYYYGDTTLIDSLTTSSGCDSLVITQITLRRWMIAIADAVICEGDSIFAGGAWQTQGGSYYDTIPGDGICNYIVITAVDVIPPVEPDTQQTYICTGDSLFVGGAFQTAEGFYPDTFFANFGCDSVVVTHLLVANLLMTNQHIALCEGDSFFAAGYFQTEAGTYYDTLISDGGCDSVVVYNLSFNENAVTEVDEFIAPGDSLFVGGGWQRVDGIYADTFAAANGCDSIVLTELFVEVGVHGVASDDFNLTVFPNPSGADFTVSFKIPNRELVSLKLVDVSGKEVLAIFNGEKPAGHHRVEITDAQLPAGAYVLIFNTNDFSIELKVIRN